MSKLSFGTTMFEVLAINGGVSVREGFEIFPKSSGSRHSFGTQASPNFTQPFGAIGRRSYKQ